MLLSSVVVSPHINLISIDSFLNSIDGLIIDQLVVVKNGMVSFFLSHCIDLKIQSKKSSHARAGTYRFIQFKTLTFSEIKSSR